MIWQILMWVLVGYLAIGIVLTEITRWVSKKHGLDMNIWIYVCGYFLWPLIPFAPKWAKEAEKRKFKK